MKTNAIAEQERDNDEEFNKLRENDTNVDESVVTAIKTPARKAIKKKAVITIYLSINIKYQ